MTNEEKEIIREAVKILRRLAEERGSPIVVLPTYLGDITFNTLIETTYE